MSDPASPGAGPGVLLRRFAGKEDYAACVELQRRTWGRRFRELVPPSVLKVSQRVGGIAAGGFDPEGRLLGFVFGFTGVRSGADRPRIVHWSHMLAVDPAARDRGLGTRLKLYQRELLLPLGVETVEWTYDPLEARNAHLNFNHLGAGVAEYVPEMYRDERGSELWRGIGTDRFVAAWWIGSPRVAAALGGQASAASASLKTSASAASASLKTSAEAARRACAAFAAAPAVGAPVTAAPAAGAGGGTGGVTEGGQLPEAPLVRVEIPADIQALKATQPEQAREWRRRTRLAFTTYMDRGWRVEAFYREPASGRCFYGLRQGEEPAPEAS